MTVDTPSPAAKAQSKNIRSVADINFHTGDMALTQQQFIRRQQSLRYAKAFVAAFYLIIPISMALFLAIVAGSSAVIMMPQILFTVIFLAVLNLGLNRLFAKLVPNIFAPFASINGFSYLAIKSESLADDGGVIFQPGSRKKVTDEVNFVYRDRPARFYQYECTIGSGKTTRQIHYSVLEINLPRPVIHTLLDSQLTGQQNFDGKSIPVPFARSQRLELEGDFNKYFDLYVPAKYGRQVLEILTPDTMHTLIDISPTCDVELVGDRMYLYFPTQILTLDALRQAFSVLDSLSDDLENKILKLPATGQIDLTTSTAAADALAATARIKTSIWKQGGLVSMLFVLVMWLSYLLISTGTLLISRTGIFVIGGLMYLVLLGIILIRFLRPYLSRRALKKRYDARNR